MPDARVHDAPEPPQAPPCTLVVFGAGGDLTKRLLMPALYNLAGGGLLDQRFSILGVDHNPLTDEGWRDDLTKTMESFTEDPSAEFHPERIDPQPWGFIRERLHVMQGDFSQTATFRDLAGRLSGNVVFYLAVAARFFGPVVEGLGKAGLLKQTNGTFRRVIIEKPFGSDLASAKALNETILAQGDESQFYRIDHFLGKETVQSILAIRFANALLDPVWRRDYVDHVEITAAETIGVEERGRFYEPTGALRDMVPNHLFQLLTMVAMEPPGSFDAEAVRDEKTRLVTAIRPVSPQDAVRGQYSAGREEGRDATAYRDEPDVAEDSRTETYVALKIAIENARWSGVPFYLRTGKCLADRRTEIAVHFKPAPFTLFRGKDGADPAPNVMRLRIDPKPGSTTRFNVKRPGPQMHLAPIESGFCYADFFEPAPTVGYETLIYDCMMGDPTLFQRADTIEASWAAVDPLIQAWKDAPVCRYPAGSSGPKEADELLGRDGRTWLPLGEK
ncbi:MAG TPA: glucose-6-phosphate dehydrogenase [Methylobacterium sp.]|jgi:glucose-6-phosphate 1-dehydrogenase|uniref:glucose-6-phosphate dehydrogenase n=1 Tax=Methylorubrum sp. B1-46 TaxID=2897334 RepID=UPI001E2CF76C|nr:glucose-6-phosphate dehydrogenase [Methylorubrum sp. B1-46]UGB23823.1 glucose-6-phosphate dehydrogenase [Methylorubrum sp. B1-46]HEV2545445.1 glucose-6-phosphate dehydrogenase [Methylobacterium sp.]